MHKSTLIATILLTLFVILGLVFATLNSEDLKGRFSTETSQNN